MEKLLAILRGLDHAENYVKYLRKMGETLSVDIHLLYIEDSVHYPLATPDATGRATASLQLSLKRRILDAKEKLEKHIKDVSRNSNGRVEMSCSAEIGYSLDLIKRFTSGANGCMIVLKNEGHNSLWERSDIDMDVIRKADCPVWIIPDDAIFHTYDEIIYATDFKEEDLETIKKLVELTGRFSPQITALHVNTDDTFMDRVQKTGFQEMIRDQTSYDKITVKVLEEKESDDLGLLVNDFATLINANLIVILKENKHFLERLFNPDNSKKIIRQASIPVLVFHEPK